MWLKDGAAIINGGFKTIMKKASGVLTKVLDQWLNTKTVGF
jgi:hypothetical protein